MHNGVQLAQSVSKTIRVHIKFNLQICLYAEAKASACRYDFLQEKPHHFMIIAPIMTAEFLKYHLGSLQKQLKSIDGQKYSSKPKYPVSIVLDT